jgi:hypothetical protein
MSPEDLPVRIVHYEDPVEGFRGFLAYNGDQHRLAAGGCRVMPGLDDAMIAALAKTCERPHRRPAPSGTRLGPRRPRCLMHRVAWDHDPVRDGCTEVDTELAAGSGLERPAALSRCP